MKRENTQQALIAFLTSVINSADADQRRFVERAGESVENALVWSADNALLAVYSKRYASQTLALIQAAQDPSSGSAIFPDRLRSVFDNLIDRLITLASSSSSPAAETQALARLIGSLRDWL